MDKMATKHQGRTISVERKKSWPLTAAVVAALATPAQGAFITIDDSDPNTITITAGDFEGGFSVDGNLLTTGLGNSNSITLPDGGYSISGSWIDLGLAAGTRVDILFALPGNPTFSTSGIEFGAVAGGVGAQLAGSFGGFVDPTLYFSTALPTLPQDGATANGSTAFLTVSFKSEAAAVPEPGTLSLLGLALFGMLLRRRSS